MSGLFSPAAAPIAVSIERQVECAEREVSKRRQVYPRLVDAGRMSQSKADTEEKASAHEYVSRKLEQTGDRELVENSWRDAFWGWGPNRNGQNMLGKLWMEIRAERRAQAAAYAEALGIQKEQR